MVIIGEQGKLAHVIYTKFNIEPVFYVYIHYRNDTGQVFYVGKGKKNRAFSKHSRSNHWHNVVNKYGFTTKIIYSDMIEEDAFIEEMRLIEICKKAGFPIVNKTCGGEGNSSKRSPEWCANHSLKIKAAKERGAYKKIDRSGKNNAFYGRKHKPESIQKANLTKALRRKV